MVDTKQQRFKCCSCAWCSANAFGFSNLLVLVLGFGIAVCGGLLIKASGSVLSFNVGVIILGGVTVATSLLGFCVKRSSCGLCVYILLLSFMMVGSLAICIVLWYNPNLVVDYAKEHASTETADAIESLAARNLNAIKYLTILIGAVELFSLFMAHWARREIQRLNNNQKKDEDEPLLKQHAPATGRNGSATNYGAAQPSAHSGKRK
eukprot:GILK01001538.1.p1 GENE.GILK01001538.1~~GILK01001538.1.p1  ORF type:complete len:223 (-),score=28.87 GILK01001538.1:232-852(-)